MQVAIPRSLASLLEMQYGIRPRAEIKEAHRIGIVKSASVYESVRFDLHENPAPRTHAPQHLLKRLPIQFVDDQGRGSTFGRLVTRTQSLRLAEKLWRNWRQRHNETKHFV